MDQTTPVPAEGPQQARLRTDVFLTFAGKGATLFLGLATAVVVARRLGPSGQGTFAVAYSLTLLLVQLGSLGLTTAKNILSSHNATIEVRSAVNTGTSFYVNFRLAEY